MTRRVSHNYSYQDCLDNSKKVTWKEDEVLGGKKFDFSKRFLPNRLSGVDDITSLNDTEKRQLNQIMGNGYCHIFGCLVRLSNLVNLTATVLNAIPKAVYSN